LHPTSHKRSSVEREHLLGAQTFTERMLLHERLELPRELCMPAGRELMLELLLKAREVECLRPRDLGQSEALQRELRERCSAPQRLRRRKRSLLLQAPEPVEVEPSGSTRKR
jgi:hypothetical protein